MSQTGTSTPDERLERVRGLLAGAGRDGRALVGLQAVDRRNVLLGAALHGADRLRQGHAPTELEQRVNGLVVLPVGGQ